MNVLNITDGDSFGFFSCCMQWPLEAPHPGAQTLAGSTGAAEEAATLFTLDGVDYEEVMWDALIPNDFTA